MTHNAEKDARVWCSEHMEPYCPRHAEWKPSTCPCCGYNCEFPRLCDVCVEEEHETPCRPIPPGKEEGE